MALPLVWSASSLLIGSLASAGEPPAPAVPVVESAIVRGTALPIHLATQPGQPYDAHVIEQDVRELWRSGSFEDIRVETVKAADKTAVIFHLTEASHWRLHAIRIEPHTFGLDPKLPEGTPINRPRAHEIALEARKRLQAKGYVNAKVDYALAPVSGRYIDLRLTVRAGEPVDVKDVHFRGDPGMDAQELRRALHAMRILRVLPGIPRLWPGWRLFPPYSPEALDADLSRLRSLYLSKGYFDASVRLDGAEIRGKAARVSIHVESGPLYGVREWTVSSSRMVAPEVQTERGLLDAGQFCSCMIAARRNAEREGILDFSVKLNIRRDTAVSGDGSGDRPGTSPVADLTAAMDEAQPYRVGRIDIAGNHRYRDGTVRRNLLLDEGNVFDKQLLRRSIARLNQTMQFEPIDEHGVTIQPNPQTGEASVTLRLTERKHRAWAISGPLGPSSFAGPLEASLSSRLPPWGRGVFELSTYAASVSLIAFARPLLPVLSITSKRSVLPVLALERPFSPGEGWRSGFVMAPQLGWRRSTGSYVVTQMQRRLLPALGSDSGLEPELPVTVTDPHGDSTMFCPPPTPRYSKLRNGAAIAVHLLGALPALL